MKILTTALFSVILLRKKLYNTQWLALFSLAIGVGIVQIQNATANSASNIIHSEMRQSMNPLKGFVAVAIACLSSGLAGVYFEMVLKHSQTNLWVRNVQLSIFSFLPALTPILFSHSSYISRPSSLVSEMFQHFGLLAWTTVLIQVFGGLVTALVIKYADNIMKGFATGISIVISFLASVALFNFTLSLSFILGSSIVLVATWLYNQSPRYTSPIEVLYRPFSPGNTPTHFEDTIPLALSRSKHPSSEGLHLDTQKENGGHGR
jgi:solute carrier family 35 (UDP-sugar transporter), member A1/2/3